MKITKEQLKQIIKEEFDQKAEINKLENRIVQAVLADRNDPMALQRLTKLSKMGKYNMNRIKKRVADAKREKKLTNELEQVIREELQAVIDEKKRKKKKKKKKKAKKRDACYYKVKSRYDVWPSAYASGALVKCRRVGAKNWGKSTTKEELELYEGKESLEAKIRKVLIDEGGAAGMSALEKGTGAEQKQIKDAIKDMNDVGLHRDGDYILQDDEEINVKKK
tara:strand:- start:1892 stop:2557 length:666 start_codon:yes stop_codon:yes gene_type:complete